MECITCFGCVISVLCYFSFKYVGLKVHCDSNMPIIYLTREILTLIRICLDALDKFSDKELAYVADNFKNSAPRRI